MSRSLVARGVTTTSLTISWSSHHFFTRLRLPLPSLSSSQVATGTIKGFRNIALTPSQLATRVSTAPSASTTLLMGQVFMQRPQAEPRALVRR